MSARQGPSVGMLGGVKTTLACNHIDCVSGETFMKAMIPLQLVIILAFFFTAPLHSDTGGQAISLAKEGKAIFDKATSKDDYQNAAQKFEEALKISQGDKPDKIRGYCLNSLGLIQSRLENNQKALEYFEQALTASRNAGDVNIEAAALNNMGTAQKNLGQYARALEYFEKSLAVSGKSGNTKSEGLSLGSLGDIYVILGQYAKALEYNEKALAIQKRTGDVGGEAASLSRIGWIYLNLNQYPKSLNYYENALAIARKTGNTRQEKAIFNDIGSVYRSMSQYPKALEYFEQSLSMSRAQGNIRGERDNLANIAMIYSDLSQYPKALDYYEQSLQISRRIGDEKGEATSLRQTGWVYLNLGQNRKALDYYKQALAIDKKIGHIRGEGSALNDMGVIYKNAGQYAKALEHYEQALAINRKLGNSKGESANLGNMGTIYGLLGQYHKALDHIEQSLEISRKIGDLKSQAIAFGSLGSTYRNLGQYSRALEYYEQSLQVSNKIGDVKTEGTAISNIGQLYGLSGKTQEALDSMKKGIAVAEKIGVPTAWNKMVMANLCLDSGDIAQAENLIKQIDNKSLQGRLALVKQDYPSAVSLYEAAVGSGEKTGNADAMFAGYTGLAKAYEGLEDYQNAEKYYEKAMNFVEDMRASLLPSERKNFFDVKIGGFVRSEPAKGLTRVRMKLNRPDGSIASSEATRARAFSDRLVEMSNTGASVVPIDTLKKEQSLVNGLAALKKELAGTNRENQPEKHKALARDAEETQAELTSFIETLWKNNPAYAAVKYPRPVTLKESALKPEECVLIFDVSTEGVGVKLIRNRRISATFFKEWDQKELENDVRRFREPFETVSFKEFNTDLAEWLYRKLLLRVLDDVPKGTHVIIIPDGVLALLPFEALITGGKPTWKRAENRIDYPEGVTFLGDEYPISYYQSITALTLTRTVGNREKPQNKLLIVADPVFEMKDNRAQQAPPVKLAESERQFNIQLMRAIEDTNPGTFIFKRLNETGALAQNLARMHGSNCHSVTGMNANKSDFLMSIAPAIEQYGSVIFATHGVMSTDVPGLMEPFLTLTMVPPGVDGFLKMSDILSLRMNADIVALTACQTGLGKDVSGEGVMSMGRAFQYAGAKSVLMSLWEVEEKSATTLAENFFKYRKQGKTKLESLKAARDEIRNAGFKHPFFWSAFILVGETN